MTVPPIISGLGKATNFKFGRCIQRNKSRLKIWEKLEHGRIQGLPKFFEYPLLSQERVKLFNLRTANLADAFTGSIRTKAHEKFGERECGRIQGRPNFFSTPYYLYELQILYAHSQYRSEQKPVTNFGKSSRGRSQDSRNVSGYLYIVRIARSSLRQLSFLVL